MEKVSKSTLRRIHHYVEIARALKPSKQSGHFFHVTFVTKKSKVLAIGINNYKKNIDTKKWGEYKPLKTDKTSNYFPAIHSEISALIKLGREDCSDLDFFNIRIGNTNDIMISKPCLNCQRVLRQVGYKNVYYFNQHKCVCVL